MFNHIVEFDFTVPGEDCPDILYVKIVHEDNISPLKFRNDVDLAKKMFCSIRDNGICEDEELLNILNEEFGYSCEVVCPDFQIKI